MSLSREEKQLMVLKMLHDQLGGKCSNETCPGKISKKEFRGGWKCEDCENAFGYLGIDRDRLYMRCPCHVAPGYSILALEEEIEERAAYLKRG